MGASASTSPALLLPNELLKQIFESLDIRSLVAISQSFRKFRRYCLNSNVKLGIRLRGWLEVTDMMCDPGLVSKSWPFSETFPVPIKRRVKKVYVKQQQKRKYSAQLLLVIDHFKRIQLEIWIYHKNLEFSFHTFRFNHKMDLVGIDSNPTRNMPETFLLYHHYSLTRLDNLIVHLNWWHQEIFET